MKRLLFILAAFFTLAVAHGQLNPIKNLQFNCYYQYPPGLNCFTLNWSPPNTSLTDSLVGYNIYRNDTLYLFTTGLGIACNPCIGDTNHTYCGFMYNPAWFYMHVTAVYNQSHIESAYNDSAYNPGCGLIIGINENSNPSAFTISPNPFSTLAIIRTDHLLWNATLTVYNSYGQQVKQMKNISGHEIKLQRDGLPGGLYFIRLVQDNKTYSVGKLVITDH